MYHSFGEASASRDIECPLTQNSFIAKYNIDNSILEQIAGARDPETKAYRSNSAAMMFKLPSTATTSLSWWSLMICGKMAKWM